MKITVTREETRKITIDKQGEAFLLHDDWYERDSIIVPLHEDSHGERIQTQNCYLQAHIRQGKLHSVETTQHLYIPKDRMVQVTALSRQDAFQRIAAVVTTLTTLIEKYTKDKQMEYTGERCECGGKLYYGDGDSGEMNERYCESCDKLYYDTETVEDINSGE